ncbi:MAG TPA: chemotaxis protein CheW [Burkholderiales bacterium]|nr:chemotaxis protein CheW [Burkholderiales bacterium]
MADSSGGPQPAQGSRRAASALGVAAGGRNWLLRLGDAGEILSVPELVRVPLTRPWYLGLAQVRGNLVSVVDIGLFSGGTPGFITPESRLVLVADRLRSHCALLVQRLLGLKDLAALTKEITAEITAESTAENTAEEMSWRGALFRDAQGGEWRELNIPALARSETFLNVGL